MAWFKTLVCFMFLGSMPAWGLSFKYLGQQVLPHKLVMENTKVGGLSALSYNKDENLLYALSDDRGKINEPRFYSFQINLAEGKLDLKPNKVHIIHRKNQKGVLKEVLDLEGMAVLPWGNFLISSEGDNNHHPRVSSDLLDVKMDGTWVRSFVVPGQFIPEKSGKQSLGIQNNRGLEGLSASPSGKILAAAEAPLVQDFLEKNKYCRFIQYESPEAWIIRPTKQFVYPLDYPLEGPGVFLENGISEILHIDETQVLVMERGVFLDGKNLNFDVRIYQVDISGALDISGLGSIKGDSSFKPLEKKLILNMKDLQKAVPGLKKIENFEGMSWGPEIKNHGRTLLLVSDDNFMRNQRTLFIALELVP